MIATLLLGALLSAEQADVPAPPPESWLTFKGRVIGHAGLAHYPEGIQPAQHLDLSIASARVGVRAHVTEAIGAVIEAELTGKPELKDGYAQHETAHTLVRFGQFKMPSLVITRESPWALPLARRGAVNEILTDFLLIAGRRPGALLALTGGGSLDATLTVGAFQAWYWRAGVADEFKVEPIRELGLGSAKPVLRLGASPAGVEIGGWIEARPFPVGGGPWRYLWTGGLDLVLDERFERHALRGWAEATWGRSWADASWRDDALTDFMAARLLGAWRWGGTSAGSRYIEPYAGANLLEPDMAVKSDFIAELVGGVNVGLWKRARAGLEISRVTAGANIPPFGTWLDKGQPSPARKHTTAILQAGAAF